MVHTQCPCSDWLVISGHQPRDLIKLVMNPNMSLGSQELSLVSTACRLILVFASFFPPPLLPSPSSSQGIKKSLIIIIFPTVGMATQAYVTELQAAPQPSQPPQAPTQAQPQPPPPPSVAPQPPQPPATATTPQSQYVTELQSPQPQAQPPGSQKQFVTELPAAPTPSQPAGTPAPSPVSQQYIVVTVSGKWTCVQSQGAL